MVTQELQSEFYALTNLLCQYLDLQFEALITVDTYVVNSVSSLMTAKTLNWAKGTFCPMTDVSTAVDNTTGAINYCGQRNCIEILIPTWSDDLS